MHTITNKFPETWAEVCENYRKVMEAHGKGYLTYIAEQAGIGIAQVSNYMHKRNKPNYDNGMKIAHVIYKTSTELEFMVDKELYRMLSLCKSLIGKGWLKGVVMATGVCRSKLSTEMNCFPSLSYKKKLEYREIIYWSYDQMSHADRIIFDRSFPFWVIFQDRRRLN